MLLQGTDNLDTISETKAEKCMYMASCTIKPDYVTYWQSMAQQSCLSTRPDGKVVRRDYGHEVRGKILLRETLSLHAHVHCDFVFENANKIHKPH